MTLPLWLDHRFRFLLFAVVCCAALPCFAQAPLAPARRAAVIEFQGPITSLSEQYLYRKLEQAEAEGADLVIVEIDSPGGEVEATMRIAARLRDLSFAETVAYIPREALSGAALLSLGADQIVIGQDAVFGDAGPIFMDEDFLFKHAPEKIRSDLARRVRDLAEKQGRSPALAEAMIDMDLVVFEVKNTETGETSYMSQAEIDASDDPETWEVIKPVLESRESKFLEVNGRRAVELGLAEAVVDNEDELRTHFEAKEWSRLEWNKIDQAILILNNPFVTGILIVVAMIALYIEFASPGIGIGGLTALICFGVFFWSRFLGGTAEWLEVVLFLSGITLIVVEIFIIPGFGVWGITGILLLFSSLVLASQSFVVPQTQNDLSSMVRSVCIVLGSGVAFMIAAIWITSRLGQLPILNRFTLAPPTAAATSTPGPILEGESVDPIVAVGQTGTAESPLRPAGKVKFGDEYIDVVSDGTFVDAGETVRIIQVHGNRVVVRRLDPS